MKGECNNMHGERIKIVLMRFRIIYVVELWN